MRGRDDAGPPVRYRRAVAPPDVPPAGPAAHAADGCLCDLLTALGEKRVNPADAALVAALVAHAAAGTPLTAEQRALLGGLVDPATQG